MIARITRLLSVLLVVGLAAAVIVLNPGEATFRLTPGRSFTAMGGVIYLSLFVAGVAVAAVFWVVFGIKAYFRERSFRVEQIQREQFYRGMLDARGALLSGKLDEAQDLWEKLVRKDPTNVIARSELSRSLEQSGKPREALKVLDAARTADPTNAEVLLRAAELNIALNNKTAAVDNLALLLYHHPSERAARLARDLSDELGRIDDALEYHDKLRELVPDPKRIQAEGLRLELKKLLRDIPEGEERERALRKFLKRAADFPPALRELASIESAAGKIDSAAELLVRAARASGMREYWLEASNLWLSNGLSERAMAAARSAVRNTTGEAKVLATLELARLLLELNQPKEAQTNIDEIVTQSKELQPGLGTETLREISTLRGLCYNQLGEFRKAAEIWRELGSGSSVLALSTPTEEVPSENNGLGPSPVLSTP